MRRFLSVSLGTHSSRRALSAALALAGLAACAGEPDMSLDLAAIAGCESESYDACTVIDAGCQEQIFRAVTCLRDVPEATRPDIRIITRAEYEAELVAPAEPASEPTAAEEPVAAGEASSANFGDARVSRTLELLGLAQPADFSAESVVTLYSESVPGYYSNEDELITLIDGGDEPRNDGDDTLIIAHEYLHALQDQEIDLGSVLENLQTFDQYLATLAVIEGEASMFEAFYAAAMWRLEGDVNFDSRFTSWIADIEESYGTQSPLLVGPRYFPYSFGARYMYGVYVRGGVAAVRDTYANMPKSVVDMIGGDLAGASVESLEALPAPAALADFELVAADTLGPWIFGKFLQRSLSQFAFDQLASHWRGDRFFVYARSDATVAGIWAVQLDTTGSAEQLASMVGQGNVNLSPSALGVTTGRNAAVIVTDDASTSAPWQPNVTAAQQAALTDSGSSSAAAPLLSPLLRRRMVRLLAPPR